MTTKSEWVQDPDFDGAYRFFPVDERYKLLLGFSAMWSKRERFWYWSVYMNVLPAQATFEDYEGYHADADEGLAIGPGGLIILPIALEALDFLESRAAYQNDYGWPIGIGAATDRLEVIYRRSLLRRGYTEAPFREEQDNGRESALFLKFEF